MKKTNEKGITLVALIVTIIVLLILASVSIAMLTGENSILNQAKKAKEETNKGEEIEKIKIAVMGSSIDENGFNSGIDEEKLKKELINQLSEEPKIIATGDGSYLVELTKSKYYINKNKDIISEENIVKIENKELLEKFRDDVNAGNTYNGKVVILTSDIFLDITKEWEPIGKYLNSNTSINDETNIAFEGIFDGGNHTIHGMKITSKEKGKGFFALIKNATIKNLIIGEDSEINVSTSFGSITGYANIGSNVENCVNKANIVSNSGNIGGIVGTISIDTNIINCCNIGNIKANTIVGGIAGISEANIDNCFNTGNINSETTNVGGIVGCNQNKITNCYNMGNITGTGTNIGGIVGLGQGDTIIENTYSKGIITTGRNGGGIVGFQESGIVRNSYFLENTINGSNGIINDGESPKKEEELKNIYILLGNNFLQDKDNINNGYPILKWQIDTSL